MKKYNGNFNNIFNIYKRNGLVSDKYNFLTIDNEGICYSETHSDFVRMMLSAFFFLGVVVLCFYLGLNFLGLYPLIDFDNIILARITIFSPFFIAFMLTYYMNSIEKYYIYFNSLDLDTILGYDEKPKNSYRLSQISGFNFFRKKYILEDEDGNILCEYTKNTFSIKKLGTIKFDDKLIDIKQEHIAKEYLFLPFYIILSYLGSYGKSNNIIICDSNFDKKLGTLNSNKILDMSFDINNKVPKLYALSLAFIF